MSGEDKMENNLEENRTKQYLSNLFKARFPLIYIATWEENRVIQVIEDIAMDTNMIRTPRKIYIWSQTEGLVTYDKKMGKDTKDPLEALDFIVKCDEASIFIMKDFHIYFGVAGKCVDYKVIRKIRDLVISLKESPKPKNLVFVSPSLVLPDDLQKEITIVDFELPIINEIDELLDGMIDINKDNPNIIIDLNENEKTKLCKTALGLTLQEAENAFARAMVQNGRLTIKELDIILEEKCQTIKKTGILEFIKSDLQMKDVGGLENLKRWLQKRNKSWSEEAQKYNLPAPKGVLITGVPGCGKSLTAKAISAMWQLPLLRLDMGKIFNGIVGSSEENMRKAIKTAEAVAPSILWIDEIEKGFSGTNSSGDSGTSTRIFGTFLTWMQEKSKPVFVVATANNINNLPSELLRKGRFDEIFFVDLPTKSERKIIFDLHLNKRLKNSEVSQEVELNDKLLEDLADMTEGFAGAEIEECVISALFEAFSEDRSLRKDDLEKVINNMVPLSITQAEQIMAIRQWANIRAVAATAKEDRNEYDSENSVIENKEVSSTEAEDKEQNDFVRKSRGGRSIDF